MGRHGGGSRSGGRSSSGGRSRGGSRGGGSSSSVRTSSTPFRGCYKRSYINRKGVLCHYYTSDVTEGTGGLSYILIGVVLFAFICGYLMTITGILFDFVSIGEKVNGDRERIFITDDANVLSEDEEIRVLELLDSVYEASGMPVTIYTTDYSWMDNYDSIEIFSEECYYSLGMDEDAMILVFTTESVADFVDWEYDFYCGDDTVSCLSDKAFDELLDKFHKGMASGNLCSALDYSWGSIMGDLAKTTFDSSCLLLILIISSMYVSVIVSIWSTYSKQRRVYKYYKKHPSELSKVPMVLYDTCPNCGASNDTQSENCTYCGTLLKISDGNVKMVK